MNLDKRLARLEQLARPTNAELIRFLQGRETPAERAKIERWVDRSPENPELSAMSEEELEALLVQYNSPLAGVKPL